MTGIFPLSENISFEGEFLSTYVTDKTYKQVNNQPKKLQVPGITMKKEHQSEVSPEIIRPFPKGDGPRKTGGRKHGKSKIPTNTPEKTEIEY